MLSEVSLMETVRFYAEAVQEVSLMLTVSLHTTMSSIPMPERSLDSENHEFEHS